MDKEEMLLVLNNGIKKYEVSQNVEGHEFALRVLLYLRNRFDGKIPHPPNELDEEGKLIEYLKEEWHGI